MIDLLRIATEAEGANGLLTGEVTAKLLRESLLLVFPRPTPSRHPTRPSGEAWGGDGLGPYTQEFLGWQTHMSSVNALIAVGAHIEAAMRLIPDGHALHFETMGRVDSIVYANVWNDVPEYDGSRPHEARAHGCALAILASALKARAAL